jgi:hypothetical protein
MFHQCSDILENRNTAVEVTNEIAKSMNDYNTGFTIPKSQFARTEIYRRTAYQYSNDLSKKQAKATHKILREFSLTYKHLSLEYKQVMLKILEPWTKNFSVVLAESEEDAQQFLHDIYVISLDSDFHIQNSFLEIFWQNVIINGGQSIRFLVRFLLTEYTKSKYQFCFPCDIFTCKIFFHFFIFLLIFIIFKLVITRTKHDKGIVTELYSVLRHFEKIPENETQFVQFFEDQKKEKPLTNQKSAFKIITQICVEKSHLLLPYLTDILQNALILYNDLNKPFLVKIIF